jgi:hypothetical protein
VVWGQGENEAEAKVVLRNLQELAATANELMAVPKGFPRIVDAAALPGTPQGAWTVVLGFCQPQTAERLVELLRPLAAGARVQTTDAPALACPKLTGTWQLGGQARVAAGSKNSLRVQLFVLGDEDSSGGPGGFAMAWLSRGNAVLESRAFSDSQCRSLQAVRLDKRRLRVKADCVTDSCTQDEVSEVSWTLEGNEAIDIVRRVGRVLRKRECD